MYQYTRNSVGSTKKILEYLARAASPVKLKRISDDLGLSSASVGATLNAYVKNGRVLRPNRGHYEINPIHKEVVAKMNSGIQWANRVIYPIEMWPIEKFLIQKLGDAQDRQYGKKGIQSSNDVTIDDLLAIWSKQDGRCAISGIPMTCIKGMGYQVPTNVSIDRIDSSIGYLRDNVELVCWAVNCMKNRLTKEELLLFCKLIIGNQGK